MRREYEVALADEDPGSSVAGGTSWRASRQVALDAVAEALGPGVERGVPLAPFTAMEIGGPADLLLVAKSQGQLAHAVGVARQHAIPFRVLGGGCNVLVGDRGVRGLVIINRAAFISLGNRTVRAESGARLAAVARTAADARLGGMAWAAGLPGTVGGAVVGNAGAFGGDVAGSLRSGTMLEPDGRVVERDNAWFEFAYRSSRLKGGNGKRADTVARHVVLAAEFQLEPCDEEALRARIDAVLKRRGERLPSGATMGSTFKNPPDHPAGKLIEQAGLKGYSVGGARISEQHANFLINVGDATSEDVLALIEHTQAEVERLFGIVLELEVELIGS